MATPSSLSTAPDAYTVQAEIAAAAVAAARAVRPQTAESVAQLVAAYQLLAAQQAVASVPPMVAEQGLSTATAATVAASSLAGLTSAGYPLSTMFQTIESAAQLGMLVASAVQDAGRNGASLQMAVTPSVTGYVRMLNPPSCSRCVVLAGKFYKWNEGFERHPMCDCRHIPSTEALSTDLTTNPSAYFDSLTTAEQDATFTAAGAQAIRDGADISQVVNARRGGVRKAQVFGREVFHTLEGVTRRGKGRQAMGSGRPYRLMPETIYAVAADRADALRLLRLYGYIF